MGGREGTPRALQRTGTLRAAGGRGAAHNIRREARALLKLTEAVHRGFGRGRSLSRAPTALRPELGCCCCCGWRRWRAGTRVQNK